MVAFPGVWVYMSEGHLVWAEQESTLVLSRDLTALKYPTAHVLHWGCVVSEPTETVNLPEGHLVWAAHESVRMLVLDATALKSPVVHGAHTG